MKKSIKVTFNDENHIISAPETFDEFSKSMEEIFKFPLKNYKVFYIDSVNDAITVNSNLDYELAFDDQTTRVHFYIADSTESVLKSKALNKTTKLFPEPMVAANLSDLASQSPYVCIGCDGRKINRKGTKNCRICKGTGLLPEAFIEKIKNEIRLELINENEKSTEDKIMEKASKPESIPMTKLVPAIYKIEADKNTAPVYMAATISESLKDGYVAKPGEVIEKVWVMFNKGNTAWPKDTVLKIVSGEQLEANATPVGDIQPGEQAKIIVNIKAPSKSGRYVSYFRLSYGENLSFGQKPWIDFMVQEPMEV